MPIDEYYEGEGSKVMSSMKKTYGADKAKRVFYATASKRGMRPATPKSRTRKRRSK